MRVLFWVIVAGFVAICVWLVWYVRRRLAERRQAEEARAAAFVSGLIPAQSPPAAPLAPASAPATAPASDVATQKLLFEAARKAGEAGEPVLAIQLYARLLARYPNTGFAAQVRAEVEAQKKKLATARDPDQNSG